MKKQMECYTILCKASFVYTAPNKSAKGGAKLNPKRKKKSEEKKIFLTKVLRRFMGCNRGMKKNQANCMVWHVVHNELNSVSSK